MRIEPEVNMKKSILATIIISALISPVAMADNHSVSLGYAQSRIQSLTNLRGVNLEYRYEFDNPLSVLASASYLTRSDSGQDTYDLGYSQTLTEKDDAKAKYFSLLVGPAYRLNEYVSLYALGGIARTKIELKERAYYNSEKLGSVSFSESKNSFAWGAGVIVNPIEDMSINIGYEGTRTNILDENYSVNGFNIGVGYRF